MINSRKLIFKDEFLEYGFIATTDKGVIKPQCVICLAVLCPESLKSSQLQKHLRNKHPELADMPKEFFAHKGSQAKKQMLDLMPKVTFDQRDSLRASLEVAWLIARAKSHTTFVRN
ncbi:SCAN domain-containing protein 3 [Oopsacas minuta]|uniref:SCAN domain-containing protein 3 n=1 Tax=Oopsacas minuta TaxID=111878 RepID=A0AAV7JDX7_9METZ|nr:SCAN domain-containing protein 3 [Oopsacas minuta]